MYDIDIDRQIDKYAEQIGKETDLYPGYAAILNTICSHYDVPLTVASEWIVRAIEETES
jgi:hypothetical protein